ncbi:DUF5597 domain-containing protein [Streptomyces sp. NPDC047841]|uniref:DUF5597 domain-containing protein n=1 Tax=Streptomyces sp. NPDC047841 TaxID=3154708 RepID=UPI0034515BDC
MTITVEHAARDESPEPKAPRAWLNRSEAAARMFVGSEPFLIRGVELHNSSSSSPRALEHALATAEWVHANTVFASVDWESIEAAPGRFDMTSIDRILAAARRRNLRVVLLWFGVWKNASSSYAPGWAKRDAETFERCVLDDGRVIETFTPFGSSALDQDAFVALVRHVERVDQGHGTVLAIQIENEAGLLGASRDRSRSGLEAWHAPVPERVIEALALDEATAQRCRSDGWGALPGSDDDRDELFMAAGFAAHIERLAAAARAYSDIPFYVNAWLDDIDSDIDIPGFAVAGGMRPGIYPSGGPLPRVAPVWRALAPSLDLFAPDYYFGDLAKTMSSFQEFSGGVLVPEMRRDELAAGQVFQMIGTWRALGVSPFGIDSGADVDVERLRDAYALLEQAAPMFVDEENRSYPRAGFALSDTAPTAVLEFDQLRLRISRFHSIGTPPDGRVGYGLVVQEGPEQFVLVGRGFRADLEHVDPSKQAGIERVIEVSGDERRLNGDETAGGTAVLHADPFASRESPFPIAMQHRHSGLTRLTAYSWHRQLDR